MSPSRSTHCTALAGDGPDLESRNDERTSRFGFVELGQALTRVRYAEGKFFQYAGLALWVVWVTSAIPGYLLGAFISDPKRFAFDLVLIVFFAAMFVPLWRGARRAIGWAVAGVVAVIVSFVVPGWWFIVIGALTGSIVGAFIDDE